MPVPLPINGPLRVAVVGAGQISELVLPAYMGRSDIKIVGVCDKDPERLARWASAMPGALMTAELAKVLTADPDVVDGWCPLRITRTS